MQGLVKSPNLSKARAKMLQLHPLSESNLKALHDYQALLRLKVYSLNTLRTYSHELECLLRLLGKVSIHTLTKGHILSHLLWLIKRKDCSEVQVHMTAKPKILLRTCGEAEKRVL